MNPNYQTPSAWSGAIERLIRRMENPDIPEDVWRGIENTEDGRFVDMETALTKALTCRAQNSAFLATVAFWQAFYALPDSQKESTRAAWVFFKGDPFDPRSQTHKIHRLSAIMRKTVHPQW